METMPHTSDSLINLDCIPKIQALNKVMRMLKGPPQTQLQLNTFSMHIRADADASLSSNHDLSSVLGYIIFPCDPQEDASVLVFQSFKHRCVTISELVADVCPFADAFDKTHALHSVRKQCYNETSLSDDDIFK